MGTQQTRDEFLANMRRIIEGNFGERPPAADETQRSVGLDPQCGVIIGLRPELNALVRLANGVVRLSPVWHRYNTSTLHLTLGDRVDREHATPTEDLAETFRKLEKVVDLDLVATGQLTNLRLRVSTDTIILVGDPNDSLLDLREQLLAGAEEERAGIKAGWSSGHLTLARLTRPLTDDERTATAAWLQTMRVPEVLRLDTVIAGLFVAGNDAFRFEQTCTAEIKPSV